MHTFCVVLSYLLLFCSSFCNIYDSSEAWSWIVTLSCKFGCYESFKKKPIHKKGTAQPRHRLLSNVDYAVFASYSGKGDSFRQSRSFFHKTLNVFSKQMFHCCIVVLRCTAFSIYGFLSSHGRPAPMYVKRIMSSSDFYTPSLQDCAKIPAY